MSKAVLISIQPKWCALIASGQKTVEVRKSHPKLEPPFTCYIYCTLGKPKDPHELLEVHGSDGKIRKANGMVIGEFVCDRIRGFEVLSDVRIEDYYRADLQYSCLNTSEISKYIGIGHIGYGWHISALLIYDKPKELSEFERPCKCVGEYEGESYCDCLNCDDAGDSDYGVIACDKRLKRPPQSWCYVEDLTGGAE